MKNNRIKISVLTVLIFCFDLLQNIFWNDDNLAVNILIAFV